MASLYDSSLFASSTQTTNSILGSAPTAGRKNVLVVEDDVALARFLCRELERNHCIAAMTHDAEAALLDIEAQRRDLLIMDLNLPKMDGMELLERVRRTQPRLPILVLTARSRSEDRVLALQQGADDCLIKPFSYKELLLRLGSLMRRDSTAVTAPRLGNLMVYKDERRVMRGARRIELTPREFAILEYLLENVNRPVSRTTLMRDIWNMPLDATTNIVDVYMKYLRDKIDGDGEPKLIRTVRGVGYVLGEE